MDVVGLEEPLLPRVLQNLVGQKGLEDLPMVDLLLDGATGEQAVNGHVPCLTNAPRPLPRLQVIARIPVGVEDDDLCHK